MYVSIFNSGVGANYGKNQYQAAKQWHSVQFHNPALPPLGSPSI
jgi:hypothetical protein